MAEFNFASEDPDETAEAYRLADKASDTLAAAIRAGKVRPSEDADLRIFVAPIEPNTRFLVLGGDMISFRDPNSPSGQRDARREGDVWALFASGICATRDPLVIAWCEGHSGDPEGHLAYHQEVGTIARECEVPYGLCRDANWLNTPAWAELKGLQQATSRRSAQLPANMDIDKMFKWAIKQPDEEEDTISTEGQTVRNAVAAAANADRERTRGR